MNFHLKQILLAVDQLANALLGGYADETLSSRAYRAEINGKRFGKFFRPLIDGIFFWQAAHCYGAWVAEMKRRQLPPEMSFDSRLDSK